MNKIDTAWAALQTLPKQEQDIAAEAILDYAAAADAPALSGSQAEVVRQRLADSRDAVLTPAGLRARIEKLLP